GSRGDAGAFLRWLGLPTAWASPVYHAIDACHAVRVFCDSSVQPYHSPLNGGDSRAAIDSVSAALFGDCVCGLCLGYPELPVSSPSSRPEICDRRPANGRFVSSLTGGSASAGASQPCPGSCSADKGIAM